MNRKTILIAIDDPDWSGVIVHAFLNFINRENARIILLNVLETTMAEEELFYSSPEMFIKRESQKAKFAYIENFLGKNNIEYTFLFEEGDAAEHIIKTAGNLGVNLVVIGSHNKNFLERVLLGSVAHKVTRLCPASVFVVSSKCLVHGRMKRYFDILLPVGKLDFSLMAIKKIPEFIDITRSHFHLLNVRPVVEDMFPPEALLYMDTEKIDKESKLVSENLLDEVAKSLELQKVFGIKKVSITGKPAHEILNYAKEENIELIVLSAHAKKKYKGSFFRENIL